MKHTIYDNNRVAEVSSPDESVSTMSENETAFFTALDILSSKIGGYYGRTPTARHTTYKSGVISNRIDNLQYMETVIKDLASKYGVEDVGKALNNLQNRGDALTYEQEYKREYCDAWLGRLITELNNIIDEPVAVDSFDPVESYDYIEQLKDFNELSGDTTLSDTPTEKTYLSNGRANARYFKNKNRNRNRIKKTKIAETQPRKKKRKNRKNTK